MIMVLIFKYSLQHIILSLYHASLVLFSVNHFLLDISSAANYHYASCPIVTQ